MARLSTEFISGGVRIRKRYPEGEHTKPQPGDLFRDRGNPEVYLAILRSLIGYVRIYLNNQRHAVETRGRKRKGGPR